MSVEAHKQSSPSALRFAVVTVSDTRTANTDLGGRFLVERCTAAGHLVSDTRLVRDEPEQILAALDELVARADVDLILYTGGTGIAPRDTTPDAVCPRFEREIPGFGELFRYLSYLEIGPATILSRACAGVVQGKVVVLLPGSPKALALAWEKILAPECGHLVSQTRVKAT